MLLSLVFRILTFRYKEFHSVLAAPQSITLADMENHTIGLVGARALARSPYLTNLTTLNVGNNHLADFAAEALAGSPALRRLREGGCLQRLADFMTT